MSSIKETMQNFAINQALKYVEGDPETNIPKLLVLTEKMLPAGWYTSYKGASLHFAC